MEFRYYNQKWIDWFSRGYFYGLCFWPIIWYRDEHPSPWQIKHEEEHIKQQVRGLLIGYYLRYWFELFWNKVIKKMIWEDAYRSISYEIGARAAEGDH